MTRISRHFLSLLMIGGMLAGQIIGLKPQAVYATGGSVDSATVVTVASVDSNSLIFKANFRQHFSGATRYEQLAYAGILTEWYRQNPNLDPNVAIEKLVEFKSAYTARLAGQPPGYQSMKNKDKVIRLLFDVASSIDVDIPGGSINFGQLYKPIYQYLIDEIAYAKLDDAMKVTGVIRRHQEFVDIAKREDAILDKLRNSATANPKLQQAGDAFFAPDLNASITASAATIINANPQIGIPLKLKQIIQQNGDIQITLGELTQMAAENFAQINQGIAEIKSALVEIDAKQKKLIDYMENQVERQKAEDAARLKAQEHQIKVDAANAGVYLLSTLIGLVDPQGAKTIATVGYAAVQVYDATTKWLETVAALNAVEKLTSLSTVVFTGNLVGAVMNVVSLFTEQGPSPEEQIMQQLDALRAQIKELAEQMHDRFDRIDQQLNQIYTDVMQSFQKVDLTLWRLEGNVQEIQEQLIRIESTLQRMEKDAYTYFNTVARQELQEAINGGLGYADRTGQFMSYAPDYVGYENLFHTWGVIHAFNPLNAGPETGNYSDAGIIEQLDLYPLDVNINYLNGWLQAKGLTKLSNNRLAGLNTWALAALAYARLADENPLYAKRINPDRHAALAQVGKDLRAALRRITITEDTPRGPMPNNALWEYLFLTYNAKAAAFATALANYEAEWINDAVNVAGAVNRPGTTFNLFGPPAQTLVWASSDLVWLPSMYGPLAAPANLRATNPELNLLNNAEYFRLGPPQSLWASAMQWDAVWVDEGLGKYCQLLDDWDETARLKVTVAVLFNNVLITRRSYTAAPEIKRFCGGEEFDPYQLAANRWINEGLKELFEANASEEPLTNEEMTARTNMLDVVLAATKQKLVTLQSQFLDAQKIDVEAGSLRDAAESLDAAKKLITAFTILGFETAVSLDDYLRSFLFGNQGLVDKGLAQLILSGSDPTLFSAAAGSGEPLTQSPRVTLQHTADARSAAFEALTQTYLGKVEYGEWVEENAMVEDTLLVNNIAGILVADAQAPDASDDTASGLQDKPVVIAVATLLTNDADANGDPLTVKAVGNAQPLGAQVSLINDIITYTPPIGFTGQGSFTYTIADGSGGEDTANVFVTIAPGIDGGNFTLFLPTIRK